MKKLTILILIALCGTLQICADEHYGYIKSATNNSSGTLYIKNTDPNPGKINNSDGNSLGVIPAGTAITNFDSYSVPWDRFGGKIYVWLVDNTNKIIDAAVLYDKDNILYVYDDKALTNSQAERTSKPKAECGSFVHCDSKGCHNESHNTWVIISADSNGKIQATFECVQ